jgi:hypothetical protein
MDFVLPLYFSVLPVFSFLPLDLFQGHS